jgi:hypothetical protein
VIVDDELDLDTLTALALAADADAPLDDDAAPFLPWAPEGRAAGDGDLPGWYMPQVGPVTPRGWHAPVVALIVAAMLVIPAFGFCITYGSLMLAST